MKWEYLKLDLADAWSDVLTSYGDLGWELVSATPIKPSGIDRYVYIFKRPLCIVSKPLAPSDNPGYIATTLP